MGCRGIGRIVEAMFHIDWMRTVANKREIILSVTCHTQKGAEISYIFLSMGSASSLAHMVCIVPTPPFVPTSRLNPLLATISPNP